MIGMELVKILILFQLKKQDDSALSDVDVFQFSNLSFYKNPKTNFKRSSSITSSLFFSCGLAVSLDNQWEQSKHLGWLCCQQKYLRIKLCIYTLPLLELLCHWQQCIASSSTISLEKVNACYIQSLFLTPQH